jgi:signal peptidase I
MIKTGLMRSLLKTCLCVVVGVLLMRWLFLTPFSIPSEGMENTLLRGDRVLVNRWSYGFRLPFASWLGVHRWGGGSVGKGEVVLFNNPAPQWAGQPLEQREVFVGRCIALPGDTLRMNGERMVVGDRSLSPNRKLLYAYPMEWEGELTRAMARFDLTDRGPVGYDEGCYMRSFSAYELYLLRQALQNRVPFRALQGEVAEGLHALVVPARGKAVRVDDWNVKLLCNTINQHEGRHAVVRGDSLWVDGRRVSSFAFSKDYFWVASDNSMSLCDSRLFGFVPEDHLIGRAAWLWFSKDPERPWWGGWRWKRFFRRIQ